MFLSDAKTRSIKPSDKPFKLTDSQGLYLVWSGLVWTSASVSKPLLSLNVTGLFRHMRFRPSAAPAGSALVHLPAHGW